MPALEFEGWNGLLAPAKTPKVVIARLHREVVAAVRHPDTVKRFNDLAAEPVGSSPEEQKAIVQRQMDQFRPVIKEMKLD
jgi:tripartite-type tricarboxylate transporter receptor subunit TctC